jgi:hypothetical protein
MNIFEFRRMLKKLAVLTRQPRHAGTRRSASKAAAEKAPEA